MSLPSYEGFHVGDTVRCTHNDNEDCNLCQTRPSACGYYKTAGVLGTVIDINDRRHRHFQQMNPDREHSIRVAFLGHDRPTVIPISEVQLVNDQVTTDDMIWKWSDQMNNVHLRGMQLNSDLDQSPDGSKKKAVVMSDLKDLSTERLFIESVFAILIP